MIVFPMAGLSRRFSEAGYLKPKYMLDLHGQTLFAHAVTGFRNYFEAEPFLFIARDQPGVGDFVSNEVAKLGITSAQVVTLARPTLGQADTVRQGLMKARVALDLPLTIFNIDTFRPGFHYPPTEWFERADGYLEVMPGSDPGLSYIQPIESQNECRVSATAEKLIISNLASTGLYWFRRAKDFLTVMESAADFVQPNGEIYVAPLYNPLIASGMDIRYHSVLTTEVIFCGTPSQYEALQRSEPVIARCDC